MTGRLPTRFARVALAGALAAAALAATPCLAAEDNRGNPCGSLENAYGPYDYRLERGNGRLNIVERFHFSPDVEGLIHGDSGYIGDDLDYVLKASPNHHRALMATVRYGERLKSTFLPGMTYSIDCYFDRAIRFTPDDTVVRELYAQYLAKAGHIKDAEAQLQFADQYAKDNALSHYNIGLLYFDMKEYDHALAQAQLAVQQGYARPELIDKLKALGKWQDPPPLPPAAASGAQAASAAEPEASAASQASAAR